MAFEAGDIVKRICGNHAGMNVGDIGVIKEVGRSGLILEEPQFNILHKDDGVVLGIEHSVSMFALVSKDPLYLVITKIKEEIGI